MSGAVAVGRTLTCMALGCTSLAAGTKFTWDVRALQPHFSITPAEGFLVRARPGLGLAGPLAALAASQQPAS